MMNTWSHSFHKEISRITGRRNNNHSGR